MSKEQNKRVETIQGAGQLAVDAVLGITDIVETMHRTITTLGGRMGDPNQTQTTGLTGFVYQSIRTVTGVVGKGLDASLSRLGSLSVMSEVPPSQNQEAISAALNGVLGDYLAAQNNPLAIPMGFRHNGKTLTSGELAARVDQAKGNVIVLVHGSSLNDLQWNRNGHDHGTALANDLGLTPIYLHYNSGLHTSENGRQFADLLEALIGQAARPNDFHILGHSMGGLVTRSAIYYGQLAGHSWPNRLKKLLFLGTPHHGAPLEKGGNWVDTILQISPYSTPFARLGKIRSSGVTDLRYGNLIDEDWQGIDRFEMAADPRTPLPLAENIQHYAFAATKSKRANHLGDNLVGDGLVPVNSALGRHPDSKRNLSIPESHTTIGRDLSHLDLLSHPEVYATIKKWLSV